MTRKLVLGVCGIAMMAAPALAVGVDFESYALGSLVGQAGDITWASTSANATASAFAALPGHMSVKSGRWDVTDTGTSSEGDDMVGTFNLAAQSLTVEMWTYASLSINPIYNDRSASVSVMDDYFLGNPGARAGLTWLEDGTIGDQMGNSSGIPYVKNAWIPIKIEVDFATLNYKLYYNGVELAALAGSIAAPIHAYGSDINIALESMDLMDNPNPNDSFLVDDIVITPEPGSLLLVLAGFFFRRR